MYEDRHGSEDKDSYSTEVELPAGAANPTVTVGQNVTRRRPKRRRVLKIDPERFCESFEPHIVGGVGGPGEPPGDYYDGFGRYAANELRQMDRQSVIIAKRLINEVMFLGQMGMLDVNTRIANHNHKKNVVIKIEDSQTGELPMDFMETP